MVKAKISDHKKIIEILASAFESNQSVNYIVRQDDHRVKRIRALMEYAVKVCSNAGKVVLSDDRRAAALLMYYPKGMSLRSIIRDVGLIFKVTGVRNAMKVLRREALIQKQHSSKAFYYLWFIGVHPKHRGLGIGSELLQEIIADADILGLQIYLETSTQANLPWYKKFGFEVYYQLELSYTLYFLRRTL